MSDLKVTNIKVQTIGFRGQYLLNARDQHLVVHASEKTGGPGESINAQELFLSSLATCALAIIEMAAASEGLTAGVILQVNSEFDLADTTPIYYKKIDMKFEITGVSQQVAEKLVLAFATYCPIYQTVSRGGPISLWASTNDCEPTEVTLGA